MLQAKKLGALVVSSKGGIVRSKSSSWKSLSPSSSRNSTPQRSATKLGSDFHTSSLDRKSSGIRRSPSSLLTIRSTSSNGTVNGPKEVPDVSPSVVKLLFFLVSSLRLGRLLDVTISLLRSQLPNIPFLLYFSFVQVLLGSGNLRTNSEISGDSSNQGFSSSSELLNAIREEVKEGANTWQQPARVLSSNDESPDDYGFFADFEEDEVHSHHLMEDPHQALLRTARGSCRNSLCTLQESEEDETR